MSAVASPRVGVSITGGGGGSSAGLFAPASMAVGRMLATCVAYADGGARTVHLYVATGRAQRGFATVICPAFSTGHGVVGPENLSDSDPGSGRTAERLLGLLAGDVGPLMSAWVQMGVGFVPSGVVASADVEQKTQRMGVQILPSVANPNEACRRWLSGLSGKDGGMSALLLSPDITRPSD